MKFFILALLGSTLLFGTTMASEYSDEITDVANDVIVVMNYSSDQSPAIDPVNDIVPGAHIYDVNGQRLGVIYGVTRNSQNVTNIWAGDHEFHPKDIALISGRLVYMPAKI